MCNNSNELDSTYSRTFTEEYNISSKSYEAKHKKKKKKKKTPKLCQHKLYEELEPGYI
jgi:hypothetical protein